VAGLFKEAGNRLRADFEFIRSTNPHSGERGTEGEEVLKQFLNKHMPQRFRAASGVLIDSDNELSRQSDIIVYDALTSPVYRASERMQIVPADSAAAVMEVKSSLSKAELEDAFVKIAAAKRLKKSPVSQMDQPSTRTGLDSIATLGIVVGFDSLTSLESLAKNVEELNTKYDSSLWPDMIVVLDKGIISYSIQWPGSMGSLGGALAAQPPKGHDKVSPPPWYVVLSIQKDDVLTLNRFYLSLLAQLTFFPYRHAGPSFESALGTTSSVVTTVTSYQFNLARELCPVPDELVGKSGPKPLRLDVRDKKGNLLAVLQHFPWQDAFVVRKFGKLPLEGLIPMLVKDDRVMVLRDPSQPGMQITSLINVDEAEFRTWPDVIRKQAQGMEATIVERDSPDYGRPD
jgi:hypothetical protein